MNTTPDRDPRKQLVTARMVLALFDNQLSEYDRMNREQRRSTPRGRELTARLHGLKQGRATWARKVAALETQIAAEGEPT